MYHCQTTARFHLKYGNMENCMENCHRLWADIASEIEHPLEPWPDLYIPKIVIAGDKKTGKSTLMKKIVGTEDLFSPELLGELTGCVQIHFNLRTKPKHGGSWSIVNSNTGESEFTSSNMSEAVDKLKGMRGTIMIFEDKILVCTVPSRIDLDIIEMSRLTRNKNHNVSNSEMKKLIGYGQSAYFICVCQLESQVQRSQIWQLIEVDIGQGKKQKLRGIHVRSKCDEGKMTPRQITETYIDIHNSMFASPKFICTCIKPGVDERDYFHGAKQSNGTFSDVEGLDGKFTVDNLILELEKFYEDRIREVWVPIQISLLKQKSAQLIPGSKENQQIENTIVVLNKYASTTPTTTTCTAATTPTPLPCLWEVNSPLHHISITKQSSDAIYMNEGTNIYELFLMDGEGIKLVAAQFPLDIKVSMPIDGVKISCEITKGMLSYILDITLDIQKVHKNDLNSIVALPVVSITIHMYGECICTKTIQVNTMQNSNDDGHAIIPTSYIGSTDPSPPTGQNGDVNSTGDGTEPPGQNENSTNLTNNVDSIISTAPNDTHVDSGPIGSNGSSDSVLRANWSYLAKILRSLCVRTPEDKTLRLSPKNTDSCTNCIEISLPHQDFSEQLPTDTDTDLFQVEVLRISSNTILKTQVTKVELSDPNNTVTSPSSPPSLSLTASRVYQISYKVFEPVSLEERFWGSFPPDDYDVRVICQVGDTLTNFKAPMYAYNKKKWIFIGAGIAAGIAIFGLGFGLGMYYQRLIAFQNRFAESTGFRGLRSRQEAFSRLSDSTKLALSTGDLRI